MNQTWYAVSSVYVESRIERNSAIACPWKKFGFHTSFPIITNNQLRNFEISFFDWVLELAKLNQTWYAVSPVYVEYRTERILAIAGLWENLRFRT